MTRDDLTAQVSSQVTRPGLNDVACASPQRRAVCDVDGFYVWDVRSSYGEGSCGVTDQRQLARTRLANALAGLPLGDAEGSIRQVRLDRLASQPCYIYGRVLLRARRDRRTGAIVFDGGT